MAGPGTAAPSPRPPEESPRPEAEGGDLYDLTPGLVRAIVAALEGDDLERVEALAVPLHAADTADLLETVTPEQRAQIVDVLRPEFDPEILAHLEEAVRDEVIERLDTRELAAAVTELDTDDAVYLIEDLDEEEQREVLAAVPAEERAALEEGLAYPENSAGRLMQRDLVAVPAYWTVGHTIDYLRTDDDLPDEFYDIFVVDPRHVPIGSVPLSRAMRTRRPVTMADIVPAESGVCWLVLYVLISAV